MVEEVWANNIETYLYSGTYAFANVPNKSYNAFSGYVISADKSNEATGEYMIDQFRSAAGGAYEGNNFGVAYYAAPSSWFEGYTDPVTLTNSEVRIQSNAFNECDGLKEIRCIGKEENWKEVINVLPRYFGFEIRFIKKES